MEGDHRRFCRAAQNTPAYDGGKAATDQGTCHTACHHHSCGTDENGGEGLHFAAKERGVISMPGAFTPSEAVNAVNMGADFVKIFPSDTLGPKYFKAISAPLSHIKFIAVGGVDHLNIGEFLKNGAVGVGVSSNILNKEMLKNGDYAGIANLAKLYVEAIENA